jgi:hypothetical protein
MQLIEMYAQQNNKLVDIYYTLKNLRDLHNLLLSKDKKLVAQAIERLADYNSIINADMNTLKAILTIK